jgi:hypothetical protein
MNLQPYHYLLIFVFILIVFVASQALQLDAHPVEGIIILSLAGAIFFGLLLASGGTEHFYLPAGASPSTDVARDDDLNINEDDFEHSKYGNIRESEDIDSMDQRLYDLSFSNDGKLDNADIVEETLMRGNAVFQPNQAGVSTTSNAQLSKFNLGEPGVMSEYNLPQTNSVGADEMLARKQQHRASINKKAIDGHIRSTKNIYQKYFANELDENEHRVWWSDEASEITTDFDPSS